MSLESSTANCMMMTFLRKQTWNPEKMRLKTTNEIKANEIPELTIEELQAAINRLKKKGKTGDSNGIRAEDIKTCDEETKEMVRQIRECTPEAKNKNKSDIQQR